MPYLQAFTNETLRLYPAFAFIPSVMTADVAVEGGVTIPADTEVWTPVWSMGRCERGWGPTAKVFDPERFLGVGDPNPYFIPFGSGSRRCLGERLGVFDVRYFLSSILKEFDFQLVSELRPIMHGALVNDGPLNVQVKLRTKPSS